MATKKKKATRKKAAVSAKARRAPARKAAKKAARVTRAAAPAKRAKKVAAKRRAPPRAKARATRKAPAKAGAAGKAARKKAAPKAGTKAPVRRRDRAGHLDPKYAAELRKRAGHEGKDPASFFKGPRAADDLVEDLGEEFVASATSGEYEAEDVHNQAVPEDIGGPFVRTNAGQEFAEGTDPSNPKSATREPFPRT